MTTSDNLSAIEKAPNRIQGMVRSIDQYRNSDPKAIADGSFAQVLYALTDYKHDVLVLWEFAVSEARKAEAMEREIAEKDAEIARLRGLIRDNGTPRFNAVCERAENAEACLRDFMEAHRTGTGLLDCMDNSGGRYTSRFLADAIVRARTLLNGGSDAQG
ncbi:hypothetical protein [Shinella sp. DD12]|uniref:hypothetical protein n=1 Tax=Shinella sp. DD12 TaxID=1410620 RepID=UPI000437A5C4|nr:hypothetical protein [Shinella sp. DD12]EYR81439.1 hypothetical protein SHLA_15c001240 [Shinella sp. DD12]